MYDVYNHRVVRRLHKDEEALVEAYLLITRYSNGEKKSGAAVRDDEVVDPEFCGTGADKAR